MDVTRRGLLIGAAAGGGLLLAWGVMPRHYDARLETAKGEFAYNAWLKIDTQGIVTVAVPQLEMGQGITTLIPQVVAMELGADWSHVGVEPPPPSGAYANAPLAAHWSTLWMPRLSGLADEPDDWLALRFAQMTAFAATADGTSLAAFEQPAREAAAAARSLLAKAAASRWDVDWRACQAANGHIMHGKRKLWFGDLAEDAASYSPGSPPLRPAPAERPSARPAGAPLAFPRLDLPAKVDGSFRFAGDVRLPDMVFAAIHHAPIGRAQLTDFDARDARRVPGVIGLVKAKRWLAAVATNTWAAEQALKAIAPRFKVRQAASSDRIDAALDRALHKGDAEVLAKQGDPDAWLTRDLSLAVRYDVAPALHATLETASATARLHNGLLELWVASQAPEIARHAVARALGMSLDHVVLYPVAAGGGFDRRLEHDHAIEAALIAREIGRPVQLTWSRWQEHLSGWPRTPVAAVLAARNDPTGALIAWKARLALPASAREFGQRLFDGKSPWDAIEAAEGKLDPLAMEGSVPPYDIAHLIVQHVPTRIALPTARLRGNAHGYTAFFTESFVDELAHLSKREPLSYRMGLLGGDVRLAQCLQRAASLANWNGGNDASGQGIACHRIGDLAGGGRIACIATARQDAGAVRVDKLSAAVDIGRIVNVDIARQQIEGGLVFGMGLALGSSTPYERGLPAIGRIGLLGLPVLTDCPTIEVEFIESDAAPFDPGELGVAVVAPAIANALFSATGIRLRRLPLISEDV